jgi:hypothetical protein
MVNDLEDMHGGYVDLTVGGESDMKPQFDEP